VHLTPDVVEVHRHRIVKTRPGSDAVPAINLLRPMQRADERRKDGDFHVISVMQCDQRRRQSPFAAPHDKRSTVETDTFFAAIRPIGRARAHYFQPAEGGMVPPRRDTKAQRLREWAAPCATQFNKRRMPHAPHGVNAYRRVSNGPRDETLLGAIVERLRWVVLCLLHDSRTRDDRRRRLWDAVRPSETFVNTVTWTLERRLSICERSPISEDVTCAVQLSFPRNFAFQQVVCKLDPKEGKNRCSKYQSRLHHRVQDARGTASKGRAKRAGRRSRTGDFTPVAA
jgi:hypothetical protein